MVNICLCAGSVLLAREADNEADLLQKMEHEQNPVKKSKYATRLSQLKLKQAEEAYGKDDYEQGQKLLGEYLKWARNSWDLLRGSGRPAEKKPAGFRELDIALREDARRFADLEHRVPFTDRDPVTQTAREAEKLRSEVLEALFPGGKASDSKPAETKPEAPKVKLMSDGPGMQGV